MKNLLIIFLFCLFCFVATSQAQTPTVVNCIVNAHVSRAFAEDIGWYGPHPDRTRDGTGWEEPDPNKPFDVLVDDDIADRASGGFIFSRLDTDRPHVKLLTLLKDSQGKPIPGYERDATVIQRTREAIFFFWNTTGDEIYSVVLDVKNLKAAIGRTSSSVLGIIGVSGSTADCQ